MSYGGLMEDWKDEAEAEHRNAMRRIVQEFNKRGHAVDENELTAVMRDAEVTCWIETKGSKVGFGDLSFK